MTTIDLSELAAEIADEYEMTELEAWGLVYEYGLEYEEGEAGAEASMQ
ncbi:hypothetical protein [Blastopirellula marina]|uniref:Uncharacterized protein n=1 Tax=Blastopirellula marina DSM 3645 TaxID=314230 RepID=A3ZU63_9BACT|nr:hypothetical protein [Blastopirellula marina]EAQ79921.1 hypothetical protein DSM3645_22314 [Blastopirellula marina DSM 3645]